MTLYLKWVYKEENHGLLNCAKNYAFLYFIFSTNGSQINGRKIKKNKVKVVKLNEDT